MAQKEPVPMGLDESLAQKEPVQMRQNVRERKRFIWKKMIILKQK